MSKVLLNNTFPLFKSLGGGGGGMLLERGLDPLILSYSALSMVANVTVRGLSAISNNPLICGGEHLGTLSCFGIFFSIWGKFSEELPVSTGEVSKTVYFH